MKRVSKKRKEVLSKFDLTKAYTLSEACDLVKGISTTKFDASVDICVRLGGGALKGGPVASQPCAACVLL